MSKKLKFPILLVLVNLVSVIFFLRKDLTEEKRYSISEASKNLVSNLAEPIEIQVLLGGNDLPGGFERLKQATQETLEEFKNYGGANIDYRFFDPNSISDPASQRAFIDTLVSKGVQPTNVFDTEGGRKIETMVYPYALIKYRGKEQAVLLLKGNQALSAQEKLNQSYENLEYAFSTAFRKLALTEKKKIGLLTEFTSLQPMNFAGLINGLQEYYDLYFVEDAAHAESFSALDALILPKPNIRIDDSTKYKIDQYIMGGGKALFFIDGLSVEEIGQEGTYAQPFEHNLQDLFFKYGVRINQDMVKDGASSSMVPLVVGNMGDRPNIQPIPYRFFPLINNFGESLITKNLDLVQTKFASTMDTVTSNGIRKTALLKTTPYTKVLNAPALVTYNDARSNTDQEEYNQGEKTIAYLLEGEFASLYQNRILPSDPRSSSFKPSSAATKIIICSDGDLVVNEIDQNGDPMPLGFDKVNRHTFANQDFLMNAIDYLVDENGVITARGKEVKLRPLDSIKSREYRSQFQLINLLLPSLLVILFGLVRNFFWRRKYA